jgi:hypothetical protein
MNISSANSSALIILKQSSFAAYAQDKTESGDISAVASGSAAQTGAADPLAGSPDATMQEEVKLYQETGQALGVNMDDYPSPSLYANALRSAVSKLEEQNSQGWPLIKKGIEHELGLDKLGISLDTVINAVGGDSDSQKALEKALQKQTGTSGGYASSPSAEPTDDIGLYSPASALQ